MTGFRLWGGGGGGICCLLDELGEEPLCRLPQVLLRLLSVCGESPDPPPPPPAYEGGRLRDFFSGVEHPFCIIKIRDMFDWQSATKKQKST